MFLFLAINISENVISYCAFVIYGILINSPFIAYQYIYKQAQYQNMWQERPVKYDFWLNWEVESITAVVDNCTFAYQLRAHPSVLDKSADISSI